eukprot:gnl/TRDRNA2_/TRDRNA2_35718_c0_seq1.p1 gnl/TRDRNA2_/TRDRNA2_35718_c0~~gnl/TRDRNA2_/TRDRNA2_35718_c0_seq1.p1  ORF type:complete len:222 (-),score=57.83 gnl/TRDRNA2_/TRDRNA2_35718_c0_seq1:73-738(-)
MASIHAALLLSLLSVAAGSRLRRVNASLLPFDCYLDKGEDYEGLVERTQSGRACMNWVDQGDFSSSTKGIGNHHYCRNPTAKHDKPWCFTKDPEKEWELCDVPKCPKDDADPEPFVAPDGAKSEGKKPCEYEPPEPEPIVFKEDRACTDSKGDKVWLISNKKTKVDDAKGCMEHCQTMPGGKYYTFFKKEDDDGNNCGCYRECVLVPTDLTIGQPTAYKMK